MDLSFVIVTYKSWGPLRNCLRSIQGLDTEAIRYEVVVVDNAPDDDGLESFTEEFSRFTFVKSSINGGFSYACNLGTKYTKGENFIFLNPDTEINNDAILHLTESYRKNELAIISCVQKKPNGKQEKVVRSLPTLSSLTGSFRLITKLFSSNPELAYDDGLLATGWVSGSLVFISRDWFDRVGKWNEDYFMYSEDVDLCAKVRSFGGKICILTNETILHLHGGTTRRNRKVAAFTKAEAIKSKHVYIRNHFSKWEAKASHTVVFVSSIVLSFPVFLIGLLLPFVSAFNNSTMIYRTLFRYYIHAIKHGTWLSENSRNYKNDDFKEAKVLVVSGCAVLQ